MIVNASISENGNAGWDGKAKAGDQTGTEVYKRPWYNKGWNVMLRCPDTEAAEKAVEIAVKLADSNLVGYDQSERNTLYQALKAHNFNVDAYIKSGKKTETDCSAFIYAAFACVLPAMRYDGNAPTTRTMQQFFKRHGFTAYKQALYLTSDAALRTGDILIKEGSHTVLNITDHISASYYYPKYTGSTGSIVDALRAVGEKDTSLTHRRKLAVANKIGIADSYGMNVQLLKKLKNGVLVRV